MAFGAADRAAQDGEGGARGGDDVAGPRQDDGDVEPVREPPRRLDRDLVAPVDQRHALARHRDDARGRHLDGGGGEQRRHLRAGGPGLRRPAGRLAQVRVGDRALAPERRGLLLEERLFLGAAHGQLRALRQRLPEHVELAAAQGLRGARCRAAAARDRARVDRHRALAGAHEQGPCLRRVGGRAALLGSHVLSLGPQRLFFRAAPRI